MKFGKRSWIVVGVFVLMAVVLFFVLFMNRQPKASIEKACNLVENLATDDDVVEDLMELIPEESVAYNIKTKVYANKEGMMSSISENFKGMHQQYEATYGSDFTISTTVKDTKEFTKGDSEYDTYVEGIVGKYGWDEADFTGYAQAEVDEEFSGSNKTETISATFQLFKYKGTWYVGTFMQ